MSALCVVTSGDTGTGERLHAVVLAAAMGTPFVAIEYRPKVRDFAKSVDIGDAIVGMEAIAVLDDVVRGMSEHHLSEAREQVDPADARWRAAQVHLAQGVRVTFAGDG